MKKLAQIVLLSSLFASLAAPARAQTRYMRAFFIQYVSEGNSSTYGDCSYFEFPGDDGILGTSDDRNLIVDGGRSNYAYDVLIPFLQSRVGTNGIIWNMLLSSAGEDHYSGLAAVVDEFSVRNYYENVRWPPGDKGGYDDLIAALQAEGTHLYTFNAGDRLSGPAANVGPAWDPYVQARVLCANADAPYSGAGDNSWAGLIQIRCGESVFLTGGDAQGGVQEKWIVNETAPHSYTGARAELADTDIYKVHHHGSKYASSQDFLDYMTPLYAVVQVAYGYGAGSHSHPTKEALDQIWNTNGIAYRNDLDGTVLVKCDSLGNFDIVRARAYVDETQTPGGSNEQVYPPPALPSNLRVTATGPNWASLDWDNVSGAYGYDVFRSTIGGGDPGAGLDANPGATAAGIYPKINTVNVVSSQYTDSGLTPGVAYYYRVSSKQVRTESGYQVCYERRYSAEARALISSHSPTPTPVGFHSPSPSPSATRSPSPSPTATASPRPSPTRSASPSPTATPSPSPGPTAVIEDVVINEILADVPSGSDPNGDGVSSTWQDEFVEMVNWTSHTVNLGGCILSDDIADRFTFPQPFYVSPGKAVVVFGGGTPTGDFGGALVATVGVAYGLSLTNGGDSVTLRAGEQVYDAVTYGEEGGYDQSLNRYAEIRGPWYQHSAIAEAAGRVFSPGTRVNGDPFVYEPTPTTTTTPTPSPTRSTSPSPTPTAIRTPTPAPSPSPPPPTATPPPSPSRTPTAVPSATPSPPATPGRIVLTSGDYNGDSRSDAALYRPSSGHWLIRGITSFSFGTNGDIPAPADYDGDGITDAAVFRDAAGLWAIDGITRFYFGTVGDRPAASDFNGDGTIDPAVLRTSNWFWAVRGITSVYYGGEGDLPFPEDFNVDGTAEAAVFRPSVGGWLVRGYPRTYFGSSGDTALRGDLAAEGSDRNGIFRPATGLWAFSGGSRFYFGRTGDVPVILQGDGGPEEEIGVFRPGDSFWSIRGLSIFYFGTWGDIPVTR
ncbi:MAG: lamin tail domain-containing protein [Candidatus Aureabacteria bacterium]|nr:lamin tail domain-containing protein [Candidatus Auribacterota bacterium]